MPDTRRRLWPLLFTATALVGCSQTVANSGTSTPPTTEAEVVVDEPCDVDALLVPRCGAWLGTSVPSIDGTFDPVKGLAEFMAATDVDPDIVHLYQRDAEPFPTAEQLPLVERAAEPDRLFYFSWKPSTNHTWRQVADGEADASIESVAAGLMAFPDRLFLTVHHEPENDVVARADSGMTTVDYVDMYRYVVERLRSLGVDNAVFVMTYMGFERWAPIVDELYPGDDVVDWIGYDPYGRADDTSFADLVNRPDDEGWPGFYSWATTKAPGKPLMLAEWGFDLSSHQESPDLVAEAAEVLRSTFPQIKAAIYWNGNGSRVDARLTLDTNLAAAFAAGFGTFAADPYFDRSPSAKP